MKHSLYYHQALLINISISLLLSQIRDPELLLLKINFCWSFFLVLKDFDEVCFNENVCTINCNKNLSDFAFISCFKHVNSNRWDSYYLGKLNVIAQNLDNFLIREKAFILDVSLGSKYASTQTFVLESIHPDVFRKISFLKGFSKCL